MGSTAEQSCGLSVTDWRLAGDDRCGEAGRVTCGAHQDLSPCTRASLILLSDVQRGPPEVLRVSNPGHSGFSQAVSHV